MPAVRWAAVSSVLCQSPGLCVQEVWEPCLGLPQSGLRVVSMCPVCTEQRRQKPIKSQVFDAPAGGVLAASCVSVELEMSHVSEF